MTRAKCMLMLGLSLSAVMFMTGCSNTIESSDIRRNLTPELFSQVQSAEQYRNTRARSINHMWRTIYDDWARIWFFDDNTRLTPTPTP